MSQKYGELHNHLPRLKPATNLFATFNGNRAQREIVRQGDVQFHFRFVNRIYRHHLSGSGMDFNLHVILFVLSFYQRLEFVLAEQTRYAIAGHFADDGRMSVIQTIPPTTDNSRQEA